MNRNIKFFVLLLILLIFGMSCSYAANETMNEDVNSDLQLQDTEINKVVTTQKNTQVAKTATKTVEVSDYNSLISEFNDNEVNKTINMKKATYPVTQSASIKYKGYSKNIVINGNGAVIDGLKEQEFLTIAPGHNVIINDLTIKNTKATAQASGIVVSSNASLILNNCNFTNDVSTGKGGALTNRGTTTINNCVFTSNEATHGGAIWSTGEFNGALHIENSKFINNKASDTNNYDKTGVLYLLTGGKVNIISNIFENNNGRSIHNFGANVLVSKNIFKNTILNAPDTTIRGTVIDNYEAPITITNNTFNNITVIAGSLRGGLLYNEIGKSSFDNNKISDIKTTASDIGDSLNGGILFNRNSTLDVRNNIINNTNKGYRVHGGALYNNIGTLNVTNNTFNTKNTASNEIRGGLLYNDKDGDLYGILYYGGNDFKNVQNNGKVVNSTIYNLGKLYEIDQIIKKPTVVTVNQVHGVIGDNITFIAHVKDTDGKSVTGGNLVFKLNGKTLKTDGTFDSSVESVKVSVINGIVKTTVVATRDIRGAKNISASYSGSTYYHANTTKGLTTAEIALRKAAITVAASPSTQKQHDVIRFTVKVKDITKNTKSSTPLSNAASYVFFKVNGVTLKDNKGKQIQAKVTNGVATYDYKVPGGMSAITKDKKTRYYNVTAGFIDSNYYPDTKNVTKFNVLKSNITIKATKIVANMTSHKLLIKANIVDYKNYNVLGTNKVNVKINGKTLLINGESIANINDGIVSLNLNIPANVGLVKEVTLVTGARTAYEGYRTTISSITRV